jgi:peroxiredoxin
LNAERIRRAIDDLAMIPNDVRSLSGRPAPQFRLPAADGREIALADCLARGPTIVWFSRGLACPICRRHRTQLARGYADLRALGAEVLEVTPTPVERARFYFSNYDLTFPYLCDPSGTTATLYGVKRGRSEPLLLLRVVLTDWLGSREITRERLYGPQFEPSVEEAGGGAEDGFVIVDRSGRIRFADIGPYRSLPSNREIEAQLRDSLN